MAASKREAELEKILKDLMPAIRDILWCALVWNDHNFSEHDLRRVARRAAHTLGYDPHNGVERVNAWMERVDRALGVISGSTVSTPMEPPT